MISNEILIEMLKMKLRNKKTGEIEDLECITIFECSSKTLGIGESIDEFYSIAELNEKWEDAEDIDAPSMPLIKDEKVREIVRALFDVWEVEDVKIDSNKYFLVTTIEAIGKGWKLEIPNININGVFKPTELCGEEKE